MDKKLQEKLARETAAAQVERLAAVEKALERLEKKIDALMKAVRDGRSN